MVSKRRLLFLLSAASGGISLFALSFLSLPGWAYAHVFIRDTAGKTGAVLHINPADDPVAGQPASFLFDVQNQTFTTDSKARLTVTESSQPKRAVDVPVTLSGSLVSAQYTFPEQGTYAIALTTKTGDRAIGFRYQLRVGRGLANAPDAHTTHAWADIGQITGVGGLIVILVMAYNRRHDIVRYSKLN